jgi:hypothetical protein
VGEIRTKFWSENLDGRNKFEKLASDDDGIIWLRIWTKDIFL